jgi:hypothetical protein
MILYIGVEYPIDGIYVKELGEEMANFVLVYSGGSMPATPEEQAQVMGAWNAWFGELGDRLVDGGNPFTQVAKHIANDGSVSDVPQSTLASGYSILKADSLDEAVDLAKKCPVTLGGAQITVYETFPVM